VGLPELLWQDVSDCGRGTRNLITDVPGVTVGHFTLGAGNIKTGVTVVMPQQDNVFLNKLPAAVHVINGFGKSLGLLQIDEFGTLETPIALTNTLSAPAAAQGLIEYLLARNPDIGDTTGTVNPVVMECNDGTVSDIRALAVKPDHVRLAIDRAGEFFAEGDIGSGAGMLCYGLKGGVGSSSRILRAGGETFALGCLVLTNFGFSEDLTIGGIAVGRCLARYFDTLESQTPELETLPNTQATSDREEHGSVIIILATDAPLNERQLKRLCKRSAVGLARTGSFIGNGSGEIAIAFSTANRVPHYSDSEFLTLRQIRDDRLDPLFRAAASATEEAVVSSMFHAKTVTDRCGKTRLCLLDAVRRVYSATKSEELSKLMRHLGVNSV
jgi:D-aminopeptidase